MRRAHAPVFGVLLFRWLFAFACEARFVFALACVAEGFVESTVRAELRVCEHAGDDESSLGVECAVGCVAVCRGLRELVVEVVYEFGAKLLSYEPKPLTCKCKALTRNFKVLTCKSKALTRKLK